MQTDQIPSSVSNGIHFFARLFSREKTRVIQASTTDTVESIHDKITSITGIPKSEQRLIYRGKQLQLDQTVSDCGIEMNSSLQLVGRLRSTLYPKAWQFMNDLYSSISDFCKHKCYLFRSDSNHIENVLWMFMSTTPDDFDGASKHLEIFISSSVPVALVMLYISQTPGHKTVAHECISKIIYSFRNEAFTPKYRTYAFIVLEFCKILRNTAGLDDDLYKFCRSHLGAIIQPIGIARCRADTKKFISLNDVYQFVREIATQISHELDKNKGSTGFLGLPRSLVDDFTAFMLQVRTVNLPFGFPITFPLMENDNAEIEYFREIIVNLPRIFNDLLRKTVLCLGIMEIRLRSEENIQVVHWWSRYLIILKELSNIAKLYNNLENVFWQKMNWFKVSLCYLIVSFATKSDDFGWIIEHKEVLNSEVRRKLAMLMIPEVNYKEVHTMVIDRAQLLEESFEYMAELDSPEQLRGRLFVEFEHEQATGPGVLREWFLLVCQEIFNPQNALFVACPNDRRRLFPNQASNVNPLHLKYFCFSGRMIALALMHNIQIGVVFDRAFFLQLSGENISLEDIKDTDPMFYNSCKQILDMAPETVDQDVLGLTFAYEVESLGSRSAMELCPNGKDIVVDSRNREMYVELLVQHRFVTSIAEQVANFANGFGDIINTSRFPSFFQCLNVEDLDLLLDGRGSDVSVEDWKQHTDYNGYKISDPQISWFWKIVECMSVKQRKVLLFFWTSMKSLPLEGFGGLDSRLCIYKNSEPYDHLPSSQTCFYRISFPPYQSIYVMQDRLRIITQDYIGCSFGSA